MRAGVGGKFYSSCSDLSRLPLVQSFCSHSASKRGKDNFILGIQFPVLIYNNCDIINKQIGREEVQRQVEEIWRCFLMSKRSSCCSLGKKQIIKGVT